MRLFFCLILKLLIIQTTLGYAINVNYVEDTPTISIKISMPSTLYQPGDLEFDYEVDDSTFDYCDSFEMDDGGYEDIVSPIIVTKQYSDTPLNRLIKNIDDSDYLYPSTFIETMDDFKNTGLFKIGYFIVPIFYNDDCHGYAYINEEEYETKSKDDEYLQMIKYLPADIAELQYKEWVIASLNKIYDNDNKTTYNTSTPQIFNNETLNFAGIVPAYGNLKVISTPFPYNNRFYPVLPKFYINNDPLEKENQTKTESDTMNLANRNLLNIDCNNIEDETLKSPTEENPSMSYVPISGLFKILAPPLGYRRYEDITMPVLNNNCQNLNNLYSLEDCYDIPGDDTVSDNFDLNKIIPTGGMLKNFRPMPNPLNPLLEYDTYNSNESGDLDDENDNKILNKIPFTENMLFGVAPARGTIRIVGSTRDPKFREYPLDVDNKVNLSGDEFTEVESNGITLDNFLINGNLQVLGAVPAKGIVKITGSTPNEFASGNCVQFLENYIEDKKYDQTMVSGENSTEEMLNNELCNEFISK